MSPKKAVKRKGNEGAKKVEKTRTNDEKLAETVENGDVVEDDIGDEGPSPAKKATAAGTSAQTKTAKEKGKKKNVRKNKNVEALSGSDEGGLSAEAANNGGGGVYDFSDEIGDEEAPNVKKATTKKAAKGKGRGKRVGKAQAIELTSDERELEMYPPQAIDIEKEDDFIPDGDKEAPTVKKATTKKAAKGKGREKKVGKSQGVKLTSDETKLTPSESGENGGGDDMVSDESGDEGVEALAKKPGTSAPKKKTAGTGKAAKGKKNDESDTNSAEIGRTNLPRECKKDANYAEPTVSEVGRATGVAVSRKKQVSSTKAKKPKAKANDDDVGEAKKKAGRAKKVAG